MFGLPLVGESRGYDFEILAPVYKSYTIASAPERDECHVFRREGMDAEDADVLPFLVNYSQFPANFRKCLQSLSEVVAVVRG